MEPSKSDYVTEYRSISIRTTDGSTFTGKLNIGHNKRISDLFKSTTDEFLVLCEVVYRDSPEKIVIVNKRHVVWAEPGD